jgi:hypothetical protein
MKRIILVVTVALVMAAMMLAMVMPAFAANNGASLEHRSNESGKGNFGQCHKLGDVDAQESSELNPSSQNQGAADCRGASGRDDQLEAAAVANCPEGEEPGAESQLTFGDSPSSSARASCT